MNTRHNWVSRSYRPGDEVGLIDLYGAVFPEGSKPYRDYWRWEFCENPVGTIHAQVAESTSKAIVGHYGVSPRQMWINGAEHAGALSLDTMTHPDFRRQGMFTALASELYQSLESAGVDVVFGFPNENSVRGFVSRLDWVVFGEIPLLLRPIRPTAFAALSGISALENAGRLCGALFHTGGLSAVARFALPGWSWEVVGAFETDVDTLWHEARNDYSIAVNRSSHYLNWRFASKPEANYTRLVLRAPDCSLRGVLVLKVQDVRGLRLGLVTELMTTGNRLVQKAMVEKALLILRELGADAAAALCQPAAPLFPSFVTSLFLPVPTKLNPMKRFWGVRRNTRAHPPGLVFDPHKWLITWGDTDVV